MTMLRNPFARTLVALAALVATVAAVGATASAGQAVKGGFYDGGDGLTIQVAASGKKIKRTYINFNTNCDIGKGGGSVGIPDGLKIRGGKFAFKMFKRFPATGGTEKVSFSGKFSADGLRVVAKFRQKLTNPAAGYNCDTGNRKLVAATKPVQPRQAGAYKGSTSQGEDLRLDLEDNGRGEIRNFVSRVELQCPRNRTERVTVGFISTMVAKDGTFSEAGTHLDGKFGIDGRFDGQKFTGTIEVTGTTKIYDDETGDYSFPSCTPAEVTFSATK